MINTLYYGNNLDVLRRHIGDESVDLIYLDPPFQSGRNYNILPRNRAGVRAGDHVTAFKDTWGWGREAEDGFEAIAKVEGSLADAMRALRTLLGEGGMLAYLVMMAPRVFELRRVLKPEGTLYLHCDPRTSHYLKILLDVCFGESSFRNEIVWRYRRMPSKSRDFQRVHDVLLRYTKDPQGGATFNQLYDALAASTVKTWGTRKQKAVLEDGKRLKSSSLAEESPGVAMGDVWDISVLAPVSKERLGYPTQKPEALLERVIRASSNPGQVVLDPFCGSGTTVAVAERLGRQWIGIDLNPLAIGLVEQRLRTYPADFKVSELLL